MGSALGHDFSKKDYCYTHTSHKQQYTCGVTSTWGTCSSGKNVHAGANYPHATHKYTSGKKTKTCEPSGSEVTESWPCTDHYRIICSKCGEEQK